MKPAHTCTKSGKNTDKCAILLSTKEAENVKICNTDKLHVNKQFHLLNLDYIFIFLLKY